MTCCFVTRAGAPPRACNQRGRSVLLWQMRAGQPQMEVLSEPWGLLVIRIGPCYSSAKKHPKASVGARSRQPCRGHQTPQRRSAWTVIIKTRQTEAPTRDVVGMNVSTGARLKIYPGKRPTNRRFCLKCNTLLQAMVLLCAGGDGPEFLKGKRRKNVRDERQPVVRRRERAS